MSDNIRAIRDAIDAAPELPPDTPQPQEFGLPGGCPVTPLGLNGEVFFYLDATRQLKAYKPRDHSNLQLLSLFVPREHWIFDQACYQRSKDGRVMPGKYQPEVLARHLLNACGQLGVWDPFERVRGPGAWRGPEGELVLHCGDTILVGESWVKPGEHGRYVYPAAPPQPRPGAADARAGTKLLEYLKTWHWAGGEIAAILVAGWIGAAMVGGALRWRPMIWITGDKATGKSTLHELINLLFGSGIISVADTTAAGIYQKVGHSSRPVAIDELEATEDNRKAQRVIELARLASSGGLMLRGGADHTGAEFQARNCFMFSSILVPPMLGQDRSRMAILDLQALPASASPPLLTENNISALGRALRLEMVRQWPRFDQTLYDYQRALGDLGLSGRAADQFGSLLACADLLLGPQALENWPDLLEPIIAAERAEDVADWQRCLDYLMTSPTEIYRGGAPRPIGGMVARCARPSDVADQEEAARALGQVGLRVDANAQVLYVAAAHQGLAKLFRESHWAARSGTDGVWTQSLRRVPGAAKSVQRIGGRPMRCTILPLAEILSDGQEQPVWADDLSI